MVVERFLFTNYCDSSIDDLQETRQSRKELRLICFKEHTSNKACLIFLRGTRHDVVFYALP